MLELKSISKNYEIGKKSDKDFQIVQALKGVDLKFRESEFVAILGQSGCGKTTLLNIIGGLDKYSNGDLIINGKSTKEYKDKDWDSYRNHSIGFVFQSYNLIPHQTVLQNVELALTLSGVSKTERRERAKKVLEKVKLGDKLNSKPNQLSGGQMQRVAIARALVNDPDIILADEPTGALDSKTSIEIMDILKEISDNKLIVMVTHNPELATTYASRIITLFDGEVIKDTNPINEEIEKIQNNEERLVNDEKIEEEKVLQVENVENIEDNPDINLETKNVQEEKSKKKSKKSKEKTLKTTMSFFTALSLSLNNLLTKRARTLLVSFAGSIGIIGIALILSLSSGFQNYIDTVQKDTLASYPITISSTEQDFTSLIEDYLNTENKTYDEDKIYVNRIYADYMNAMQNTKVENNLKEFKNYIDSQPEMKNYVNDIKYSYNLKLKIYYDNGTQISSATSSSGNSAMMTGGIFEEIINNPELIKSQYKLLKGDWFDEDTNKNVFAESSKLQMMLVVNENNQINDITLYSLGLFSYQDLMTTEEKTYTFEEILESDFFLVTNDAFYEYDTNSQTYKCTLDSKNKTELKTFIDNLSTEEREKYIIDFDIVGIIKPNEDAVNHSITGTIAYTSELTHYLIDKIESRVQLNQNHIVNVQKNNTEFNILNGKPFYSTNPEVSISSMNHEEVLNFLGSIDKNSPKKISFYPNSFESKDKISQLIEEYNNLMLHDSEKGKDYVITYTDYIGIMMSSISSIINAISYVLIAFVSVSLIVSSIMIGIITYISVLERIKEIGVLRSIGASKKDIKRVFTAESLIIGLSAGLVGILISLLLIIPINAIILALAGLKNVAALPIKGAIILVVISMVLTYIAGLIPAKIASKKDPVIALRTE